MAAKDELEIRPFASQAAWAAWLRVHHAESPGLWLKIGKQANREDSVTYAEALEEALCYGWIDGQKRACDDSWWLQHFTPRGPRSKWSQLNRDKAEQLIKAGRMQAAGLAAVEAAKADGRWDAAYASARTMEVPDDLERALEAHPKAAAFFKTLDSANRYAVLYRIHDAKRPETRARRIAQFVEMLERGEKLHP